jgi:hypothetical protein
MLLSLLASPLVPGIASGASPAVGAETHVGAFDLTDSLLAARGGGRGANNLTPDPNTTGPHSTWKTDADGNVTGHAEWKPNPQNPSGFDEAKRVDIEGKPHFNKVTGENVPTPHAHGKDIPGGVRPARPDEIPGGGN